MKCFIHDNRDAQGVCLKCGKAMCKNCMRYTKYSKICPTCYKKRLIKRAIICVCQAILLSILIFNFYPLLNSIKDISYIIANYINNSSYVNYFLYILIGWGSIAVLVAIKTIKDIIIIHKAEKSGKATLSKYRYEKIKSVKKRKIEKSRYISNHKVN